MRLLVVCLVALVACNDDQPIAPDASVPMPDALTADYYGEACEQPSSLGVVSTCRRDAQFPKAYCTPQGVCRPFCSHVAIGSGFASCADVGGKETWAFKDSDARVCYCEPR